MTSWLPKLYNEVFVLPQSTAVFIAGLWPLSGIEAIATLLYPLLFMFATLLAFAHFQKRTPVPILPTTVAVEP